MSTDELAKLQKLLDLGDKVVPIAKFTLGTAAAIMSAVLGIAVWVWTTNASIAAARADIALTARDLSELKIERSVDLKDLNSWRMIHEKSEANLIAVVSDIKEILKREQDRQDFLERTLLNNK